MAVALADRRRESEAHARSALMHLETGKYPAARREIDRALAKMTEESYGLCEGTGLPIGYARLKLYPWARFSAEHQEEVARAQRSGVGV